MKVEHNHLYSDLFFENCPVVIMLLDPELRLVDGTKVCFSVFGYQDASDAIGSTIDKMLCRVYPQIQCDLLIEQCRQVLEQRTPKRFRETFTLLDGGIVSYQITITTALDENGGYKGIVVVMVDITELMDARNMAEEASRAKTAFLANMSHEIRTPMNAIKGLSELMLMTELSDVQRDYALNVINASNSLLQILNDVLDYSKIDSNTVDVIEMEYDFSSFLRDVTNTINLKAMDKGLQLHVKIDPTLPSVLRGDDVRVKQIMINILSNAVKFTRKGCVILDVSGKRLGEKIKLYFKVTDTGIGIHSEDLSKLFQPFSPLSRERNDQAIDGTGLGLSISREFLHLMDGDIEIQSTPDVGTEVSFWLEQQIIKEQPLAMVNHPQSKRILLLDNREHGEYCSEMLRRLFLHFDHCTSGEEIDVLLERHDYSHCLYDYGFAQKLVEKHRTRLAGCRFVAIKDMRLAAQQLTPPNVVVLFEPLLVTDLAKVLNRPWDSEQTDNARQGEFEFSTMNTKALVVDDNEVNLMVSGELLRCFNVDVILAESGTIALDNCERQPFDLIFMDHMMPVMDGIETTKILREGSSSNRDAPIIALTANAVSGMREYFLESGMDDFVSKPIDMNELSRVLAAWLPSEKIIPHEAEIQVQPYALSEEMDNRLRPLEDCSINVIDAVRALDGNESIYISVLETFSRELGAKISLMRNCLSSDDWNLFVTEVHGIKSALASIGAQDLSLAARNFEIAAREGNGAYIREPFESFLLSLSIMDEKLQLLFGGGNMSTNVSASEQDPASFAEDLERMVEALDELDNEAALSILERLISCAPKDSVGEVLAEIKRQVETFNYDAAAQAIINIQRDIEKITQ